MCGTKSGMLLFLTVLFVATISPMVESFTLRKSFHFSLRHTVLGSLPENSDPETFLKDETEVKKWYTRSNSSPVRTIDDIWAGYSTEDMQSAILAEAVFSARSHALLRAQIRLVNPIDEQTRFEAYSRLRQRMFELVRGENCDSRRGWVRAFERWQYLSKNYEWSSQHTDKLSNLAFLDPLLPSVVENNPAEVNLMEDLKKLDGMSVEGAKRVSRRIQNDSFKLSDALYKRMLLRLHKEKEVDVSVGSNTTMKSPYPVSVTPNKYNGDLKVSLVGVDEADSYSKRFRVFTISAAHAFKLQKLWGRNKNSTTADSNERGTGTTNSVNSYIDQDRDFENALFCLLARYSVLEGYGWQAAVAQPALGVLHQTFGVTVECFSSPLNSYLPSYCSLFPDTDAAFGSLGSFFDFYPLEGSFEANPPFVMPLMVQMVAHIEHLLASSTGPMSFAVVVPAWVEDAHFPLLMGCEYNRGHFTVPAAEHSYCDGGQHENGVNEKYRPAPFDTAVFFLQNEKGHEKWPVTAEKEKELRDAFAAARPSQEILERQRSKGLYVPKFKAERGEKSLGER